VRVAAAQARALQVLALLRALRIELRGVRIFKDRAIVVAAPLSALAGAEGA